MYLNREMYTHQDMENISKTVQPMIQKVADLLLRKVSASK